MFFSSSAFSLLGSSPAPLNSICILIPEPISFYQHESYSDTSSSAIIWSWTSIYKLCFETLTLFGFCNREVWGPPLRLSHVSSAASFLPSLLQIFLFSGFPSCPITLRVLPWLLQLPHRSDIVPKYTFFHLIPYLYISGHTSLVDLCPQIIYCGPKFSVKWPVATVIFPAHSLLTTAKIQLNSSDLLRRQVWVWEVYMKCLPVRVAA